MPIDASIYGDFIRAQKPFATMGEIANVRQQRETTKTNQQIAQDTLRLRQQELADKQKAQQQEAEDNAAIEQVFQQHTGPDGPNKKAIIDNLYALGKHGAAQKVETAFSEGLKKAAESHKLELENQEKEATQIGQLVEAMNPQNAPAISSMIKTRWPDFAGTFGIDPSQPFDPSKREAAITATGRKKDYLANQKAALENTEKPVKTFLELAAIVPDAQHYANDAWEFAKAHQITDELRSMGFSEAFDPSVSQRAKSLALGQKEMATIEGRQADDRRMAATAAETARHNAAMERQGAQRIAQAGTSGSGGASSSLPDKTPAPAKAVFDRVLVGVPGTRTGAIKSGLTNLVQRGASEDEMKSFLRLSAVETLDTGSRSAMVGRLQTLKALNDAQSLLESVPTGYLKGNWENTMRALGTTSDPKMVELGTRMGTILANYMRSISGAAIADKEADRLGKLIPNYTNTLPVNKGQIKGFSDALRSFDNAFYEYKFGDNYDWVMGTGGSKGGGNTTVAPAEGRVRVKGPNGQTGTVPSGGVSSLPQGWSVVK